MDRSMLDQTIAPLLIAVCLSCLATGVVFALAMTYWTKFTDDHAWIRASVALSVLWLALDTIFNVLWAYDWLVTNFLDPSTLMRMPWQLTAYCITMPTSVLASQAFFIWRVWIICGKKNVLLVVMITSICLACYGIAIRMAIFCAQHKELASFGELHSVSWAWFAGTFVADVGITASVVYYLSIRPAKSMKGSGMRPRSSLLQKIVVRAIQANALAALCQIGMIALYAHYPTGLTYTIFGFMESKIYIASFIATLNIRSAVNPSKFDSSHSNHEIALRSLGLSDRSHPHPFPKNNTIIVTHEVHHVEEDGESEVGGRGRKGSEKKGFGDLEVQVRLPELARNPSSTKGDVDVYGLAQEWRGEVAGRR